MRLVSYEYYRDAYCGTAVPQAAFAVWSMRAEERLSADTCGRSDGVLLAGLAMEAEAAQGAKGVEAVIALPVAQAKSFLVEQTRRAVCAVAEILYHADEEARKSGNITRETVGGWSRSYAARDARETQRAVKAAQAIYLGGTGLLYRGCRR